MRKILVVEDNELNLKLVETILDKNGFDSVSARNGHEGVVAAQMIDSLDLILMDLQMPGMDGFEAMRVIKAISNLQHVPVIAITGNATNEDRSRALDAGFDDFISKPF